jgi:hypothetical protein
VGRASDCPTSILTTFLPVLERSRAQVVEQQVIKWLKQVVKGFAPDDVLLAANRDDYEQRHQRAQLLYLAGELSEEIYLSEKEK